MWTAGGYNAFLASSHANRADALAWEKPRHDRRLASRCVPTDGGGASGNWLSEATIKGRAQAGHLPTARVGWRGGHRPLSAMDRVARQSLKRGYDDVCGEDPVSCALMSGLLRGVCRWPSWVCACVLGANLYGVLEAHDS